MEYKKEMIHYTAVGEALVTIADAEKWYIQMFYRQIQLQLHISHDSQNILFFKCIHLVKLHGEVHPQLHPPHLKKQFLR